MSKDKSQEAWNDDAVFRDEPLHLAPKRAKKSGPLPEPLRKARALEEKMRNRTRAALFLREGRMLADYADDFDFFGAPTPYYPVYKDFSDDELRGYFAWRAKFRKGQPCDAPLGFILLHANELLNGIGAQDPGDGFMKLAELRERYGDDPRVGAFLDDWLIEYIVYYNLETNQDENATPREKAYLVLKDVASATPEEVAAAVKALEPKWLGRSRFYASNAGDMDAVIVRVLKRMAAHYAKNTRGLFSQFFGVMRETWLHLFSGAVFCDPLKIKNHEYAITPLHVYRCSDGLWSESRFHVPQRHARRFEKLLKTIDSVMRELWGESKNPVRPELSLKWLLKVIREEAEAVLAEKTAREKNRIDFSRLDKIRADSEITRDRLIVDEEAPDGKIEEEAAAGEIIPAEEPSDRAGDEFTEAEHAPAADDGEGPQGALSGPELRLLRSLLYGGDLGWAKDEGLLLSVLADGVNEKLYDSFGDSVLDDGPAVIEDYVEALKEMIPA